MHIRRILALCLIATAVACGGDSSKGAANSTNSAKTAAAPDYKQQQLAFADSVLNAASSTRDVAKRLGNNYDVGSIQLRDTVAALAAKTQCFATGRGSDPYLAGTVTFWVNMSLIGTDVIRVQESKWTSPAGNVVDACLNQTAKNWKLDPAFGKPKAYLVQVQFK